MDPFTPSGDGVGVVAIAKPAAGIRTEEAPAPAALDSDFGDVYERLFSRVYAFMRSQCANTETAEELTSQVFVRACRGWSSAPRGEEATFWVFCIARRTMIDYWRGEGRRAAANVSLDEVAHVSDDAADPERACATKERWQGLLRVTSTLEAPDRELIALKFAGQQSNQQIAAILGLSEAAVSMRSVRALRRLRDRLRAAGLS
jgi:RNA polymerase sigma-70 factor (ECF subfamily)